jgi:hypothetical protein
MAFINVPDRTNELTAGAVGSVDAATEAEIGPHRKSRPKGLPYANRPRRTPRHGRWCFRFGPSVSYLGRRFRGGRSRVA